MTRARLSLLLVAVAVASLPACASTPDTMVLGLAYQPTSQVEQDRLRGSAPVNPATRVWINPIYDLHPEGSQVGVSQQENNAPVYFGAQGLPPADFVRNALLYTLPGYGVPLAADPGSATHILELKMTRFWTVEANVYQATVTASAVLATSAGVVVWQAEVTGTSKRWGRTFQTDAYLKVFSDAALDFGQKIALDPGFRAGAN